ncbi:unnamed protein product [Polarella glacialis]|uniref:Uncharacterized protein n=2 Tax=Polarella glacialis TaxID=89957 RepID=A0A813LG01_POLGL|nr:unnamed protein product [Polarella glacialis]
MTATTTKQQQQQNYNNNNNNNFSPTTKQQQQNYNNNNNNNFSPWSEDRVFRDSHCPWTGGYMNGSRTLAGLVSVSPDPPLLPRGDRKVPLPSPPQIQPPTHAPVAARLAMAAAAAAAQDTPFSAAAFIDLSHRVRRALPATGGMHSSFGRERSSLNNSNNNSSNNNNNNSNTKNNNSSNNSQTDGLSPALREQRPMARGRSNSGIALAASMGLPLVQVSSWLPVEVDGASLPQRDSPSDASPISPGTGSGGMYAFSMERYNNVAATKRRHRSRRPQAEDDETAASTDSFFSISGIRLDAKRTAVEAVEAAAAAAAAAAAEASAAAAAASKAAIVPAAAIASTAAAAARLEGKAAAMTATEEPALLAEALTAALGKLRRSPSSPDFERPSPEAVLTGDPVPVAPMAAESKLRSSASSWPVPSRGPSATLPGEESEAEEQASTRLGPAKCIKRACVAAVSADREAGTPELGLREAAASAAPGSAPSSTVRESRRALAQRAATQQAMAATQQAIRRSKSMPLAEKAEKRSGGAQREAHGGSTAAGVEPGAAVAEPASSRGPSSSGVPAEKTHRKSVKSAGAPPASSGLSKSNAAAVAGAGSVAAKARGNRKGGKLVLPFSYGFEDPRYFHVESTECRLCPEIFPSKDAMADTSKFSDESWFT